ncbi:hypothetical protein AALP_AA4G007400 [Arabis alpina]|uniref:Uncharacterized protein n=1 Tax=Arabis alpina TaxID=50452 RepID=A0A087H0B4_ARAAL|nr:hypothetical protein AALP_AA4G007400 [Arabis alpina]
MLSSSIRLISSRLHQTQTLNSPTLIITSIPRFFNSGLRMIKTGSGSGQIENRASRMKLKLEKELKPIELVIEDVSYQHAGHAGMKGRSVDEETHFNVKIVSNGFEGMNLVKRHRLVYELLKEELDNGLHALSIVSKTPSETTR